MNRKQVESSMGHNYCNAALIRWTLDSKAGNYYFSLTFNSFSLASHSQLAVLAVNIASQVYENIIELQKKKVMLESFLEWKIICENIANNRWIGKANHANIARHIMKPCYECRVKRTSRVMEMMLLRHQRLIYHVFLFVFDIKAVFVFNVLPCWPILWKIFFCVHFAVLNPYFLSSLCLLLRYLLTLFSL